MLPRRVEKASGREESSRRRRRRRRRRKRKMDRDRKEVVGGTSESLVRKKMMEPILQSNKRSGRQ